MGMLKWEYLNEEGVLNEKKVDVCGKCCKKTMDELLCLIKGSHICMDCFWEEAVCL